MQTRSKSKAIQQQPRALLTTHHPTIYTQASKYLHRREVMARELDALVLNHTWSLVPFSNATNVVCCK
jgi:hypothetical protein